jgi:HAE1 family hydrophobic/amphiphilic exporter-1
MNISEFCIRRPIATLLMSLSLVLAGLFAYSKLPVAARARGALPHNNP